MMGTIIEPIDMRGGAAELRVGSVVEAFDVLGPKIAAGNSCLVGHGPNCFHWKLVMQSYVTFAYGMEELQMFQEKLDTCHRVSGKVMIVIGGLSGLLQE